VAPLLEPGATYQDSTTGKPFSGPALATFLVTQWNDFPESRYDVRSVNGTREFVAVEWSATNLGAATAQGSIEGVFLLHLNGDRITSVRGYSSTKR